MMVGKAMMTMILRFFVNAAKIIFMLMYDLELKSVVCVLMKKSNTQDHLVVFV